MKNNYKYNNRIHPSNKKELIKVKINIQLIIIILYYKIHKQIMMINFFKTKIKIKIN